jgi:type II secretory pathway pseudopilin PulG
MSGRAGTGGARGYMLLGALFLTAVMAITMAVVAREWSFIHRRAMEAELKHRGEKIMRALLEYQYMQGKGLKPASRPISNYETLEKFLTEGPNPVLPSLPPDPMTARYDERGELVEGTGKWGLVVRTTATQGRQSGRPGTSAPVTTGGFQVIGCEGSSAGGGAGSGSRSGSIFPSSPGSPGSRVGAVVGGIIGVASCLDDENLKPIGLSPEGEEASSYKEWLFTPVESGGTSGLVPQQQQQRQTSQQQALGSWQNNWPSSLPAPPFPGGVIAPGGGRQVPQGLRPGQVREPTRPGSMGNPPGTLDRPRR